MESDFILSSNLQKYSGNETDYHAMKDYISASAMKLLKVSPLHYKSHVSEETEAMQFGSAYHCYILEPDKFDQEYFVFDDSEIVSILRGEGSKNPRNTNKYKEWADLELAKMGDRKTVSKEDLATIKAMKDRLFKHHYARQLLSTGEKEQGIFGTIQTQAGEVNVKFKPDNIKPVKRVCIDLKTCADASINEFSRHAASMDYHIQAAFYVDMLEKFFKSEMSWTFIFIAQEKTVPYAFNLFEASPQFIGQGRYEYEMLIQMYLYCLKNDKWPGYQIFCQNKYGVNELNLPAYSIRELTYYDHK